MSSRRSKRTQPTLAQTVTFSVCEAIQRFSEKVQPVTAKFVLHKPSSSVPVIKKEALPEESAKAIDLFSEASEKLQKVKRETKEKSTVLKEKEREARKKLYEKVEREPEQRARVELERAAPIPSSVRSVAEDSEEESEDEEESDEEEDDVVMLDDQHSARSSQKFVVGTRTVKKNDPEKRPLSQIKMRGVVLGATCKVLYTMSIDPDQPAQSELVRDVLGNVDFWERTLRLVRANVDHVEQERKIEELAVFIKEEKTRTRSSKQDDPESFLESLIRQARK